MLFYTGSRSITQEVLLKDITESTLGRKIYSGVEQFSICLEYSARCVVMIYTYRKQPTLESVNLLISLTGDWLSYLIL